MRTELETRPRTWVPADPSPAPLVTVHGDLLPTVAGELAGRGQYTGHARQDDDALTQARATLLVAAAYIVAAGLITLGLLLLVWVFRGLGQGWATYAYTGLLVWGCAVLAALWGNRKQALRHSAPGIALREIDMRERVALHAIDTHAGLLLAQMEGHTYERN